MCAMAASPPDRCAGLPLPPPEPVESAATIDMLSWCEHVLNMSTMIQIRNVPDEFHRRAKARAALEGVTLSDLALRALRREVEEMTLDEVVARVRELGPVYGAPSAAHLIREERDGR